MTNWRDPLVLIMWGCGLVVVADVITFIAYVAGYIG